MKRILIEELHGHIGKEVKIAGWVDTRRDQGKLIFLDIRDMTGKVQAVIHPNQNEAMETGKEMRTEWVVEIVGVLNERPEKNKNTTEKNGDIELEITKITVLNKAETPAFDVTSDGKEIGEESRLAYKYIDLRRPRLQQNIRARHRVLQYIRNFLTERKFT